MSQVIFEKFRYTVDPLYQWDLNQTLEINGLSIPSTAEMHYTSQAMVRAIVRPVSIDSAGIITSEIPNSLLQKPYKIIAYICVKDGTTFKTLYTIEIPVKARSKPCDYTLTHDDNEVYSFEILENLINETVAKYNLTIAEVEKAIGIALSVKDGASAYEVAVAEGFEGSAEEWLASLIGPRGPQGEPGSNNWNDIVNKPFYDESEVIDIDYLTYDTDVSFTAALNTQAIPMKKISDVTLSYDELIGLTFNYVINGESCSHALTESDIVINQTEGIAFSIPIKTTSYTSSDMMVIALQTGDISLDYYGQSMLATIPETGLYVAWGDRSRLATEWTLNLTISDIKTLDSKYLPPEVNEQFKAINASIGDINTILDEINGEVV